MYVYASNGTNPTPQIAVVAIRPNIIKTRKDRSITSTTSK